MGVCGLQSESLFTMNTSSSREKENCTTNDDDEERWLQLPPRPTDGGGVSFA